LFKIDYFPPSKALSPFVSMFYRFETDGHDPGDFERADIPHYRFHFGAGAEIKFGNGHTDVLRGHCVIGPRNRGSFVKALGPGVFFGFGILPAGWAAIVKKSAMNWVEQLASHEEVVGPLAHSLDEGLHADMTVEDFANRISPKLEAVCLNIMDVPLSFLNAVEQWLRSTLDPDIEELVKATGFSARKIDRLIRDIYGASPALFIRKSRALRVANRIAHGEGDWQDYVVDSYYDQSHCIKEIKYFTGITPAAIRDGQNTMNITQFQRRRTLASDNAPSNS
jgi:AraC-like DNA-binding protein